MAYEKLNFENGKILTAEQLNHIEDGIANALFPEKINELSEITNLLADSGEYWNHGFCQTPAGSAQDLGSDTLSAVKGGFNYTVNYITGPVIRLDSSKSYSLEFSTGQWMRQLRIFNASGVILCSFGNNETKTFGTGLMASAVNAFKSDATMTKIYPNLTANIVDTKWLLNAATIKELNTLFKSETTMSSGFTTYVENEPVYVTFNMKTTTNRPSTEDEVAVWYLQEAARCHLYQTEIHHTYELTSLVIPDDIAKKYYDSPLLSSIIREIGTFIDQVGMDNTKTTTQRTNTVYSELMVDGFYPDAYVNYYMNSGFSIADANTPTYRGYTAYDGYKISIPMPIDLTRDGVTYTCTGFMRHYAFCDEKGNRLYYGQNSSDLKLTVEYFESIGVDPLAVKYLCVSNRDANLTNFKLTVTVTRSTTTYELPNLRLTSNQSTGGGGGSDSTGASNVVDLTNVDRIVSIGDSYTESHYTIKDKSWMSKVSLLSDYNYDNFAISGDTYRGQLNKIRKGNYSYASTTGMTWEKLHPTHTIMISKTNDTKYMDCQQFIYDMIATIETTKGLGAIPIIATEYHVSSQDYTQTAFDYYAKKYGGYYIDLTEKDYTLRGADYAPFWGGSHPGTRTNHLFSDVITDYINKNLPRPYSSIKIFRPRDNSLISNLDNYIFGNIEERAEKFKEISICHSALRDSSLYDNCTNQPNSKVESEYFKLMTGMPVEFDKVCLIDVILPTTVHDISEIQLVTNAMDGVNCYVKDVLAEPYPSPAFCRRFDVASVLDDTQVAVGNKYTSSKTTGVTYTVVEILYDQVESDEGFVDGTILICSGNKSTAAYNDSVLTLTSGTGDATLPCTYEAVGLSSDYPAGKQDIGHYVLLENYGLVEGSVLKRAVDYDKITFLLVSDSAFNLRNVEVKFKGNITKTRNTPVYNNTLPSSYYNNQTSLLTHNTFDSSNITYWLKNNLTPCGLTPETPVDGVLPKNISRIVTLTPDDGTILQSFTTTTAGNTYNMNHKVKVWARYFPDIFDATTMTYPDDASITENSFDWAKLNIQLYNSRSVKNNATVKMPKLIGLHWTEVEVDITLPPVADTWYIGLSAEDKPIQLAYMDVV